MVRVVFEQLCRFMLFRRERPLAFLRLYGLLQVPKQNYCHVDSLVVGRVPTYTVVRGRPEISFRTSLWVYFIRLTDPPPPITFRLFSG